MEEPMKTLRFALGSLLFLALFATASIAQNNRTFVSGAGLDTNPCSLTAPCRTFTQAISQTNAGGEVVVLTSAGYGPFSINKSITVEAPPGVYAGIAVPFLTTTPGGAGIFIEVAPSDTVVLRGLTVNAQGSENSGIEFDRGGTLHIEKCIVNGFSFAEGIGINWPGNIFVEDTIATGNGYGVSVDLMTTGTANVAMDRLHLDDNGIGLNLSTYASLGAVANATIRNSSASGNDEGMNVLVMGGPASLVAENCLITNNGTGMEPEAYNASAASISISNCTIANNIANGYFIGSGATIYSRGNNTITGNGSNNGMLTPLPAQ
jgi:hypothetical protein